MKRKIFCGFIALVILLASIGKYDNLILNIWAADDNFENVKCGDTAYWSLDIAKNQLVIFGTGVVDKYTFPINVDSVVIHEGITGVGAGAFRNSTLRCITFPESLNFISDNAFWGCEKLTVIELPSSLKEIGTSVFEKCFALKSITVKEDSVYFSAIDGVLYDKNISELVLYPAAKEGDFFEIPGTVTKVAFCAFDYNKYIKELFIPRSVVSFGDGVPFYKAESIERFIVSDENLIFSDMDGNLYNKELTTLIKYAIGKSEDSFETISSVTTIKEDAFCGAKYLKNVIFSDKINLIEYGALADCKLLTGVTIMNPNCLIASSILASTFENNGFKMFGYINSTAMQYAIKNKISFEEIEEKDISSIEVLRLPKKLIYKIGEDINTIGLVLKILYVDGTYSERSVGYEIKGYESDIVGIKEITVLYQGMTTKFCVEVVEEVENVIILNGKSVTVDIIDSGQTAYVYFTPTVSAVYNYYATSNSDTIGYIYDIKGNLLAQNDDGPSNSDFYISYHFEAGVTYKLACKYLFEHELGSFDIIVENYEVMECPRVSIDGYQISNTVGGFRTIYSVEDLSNCVVACGLVYGLYDIDENELVVDSANNTVYNYESTDTGRINYEINPELNYLKSTYLTSYVMTMKFIKNASFYNARFNVRAYAKLLDGSYVYSDMISCTIYELADNLYQNKKMTTIVGHDYLYNNILTVVDNNYKMVTFDYNTALVK